MEVLLVLDPPLHWEYWHWIKGWYWAAVDRAPPPTQEPLERIMVERVELYSGKISVFSTSPVCSARDSG